MLFRMMDVHVFVADVIRSFDTVDRGILDRVLSSLGLLGWFRHAYFEYHAHVRLRFKLASGLGAPWSRDGEIPQGCPLSMMFIVALYLPCRYLAAQEGVQPQQNADNLKCVSRDPGVLLRAARFTTGYVRLVGQEPAPSKCVFLSTSRVVRREMRDWVVTDEGDRWTVKLDVRDLGGHLDTTFRGWSSTLAKRVRVVLAGLLVVFALPLHFHGRLIVLRNMFIPCALHGIEASFLAESSVRKLRAAFCRVSWSCRQPLAHVGAVLSWLDGPVGCDPAFCVVWFRFRQMRRYLAYRRMRCSGCIGYLLLLLLLGVLRDMVLLICFLRVLLRLDSVGALLFLAGVGLACLCLIWWLALFSIFVLLFLMPGVIRSLCGLVFQKGFSRWSLFGCLWHHAAP